MIKKSLRAYITRRLFVNLIFPHRYMSWVSFLQ